MRSPPLLSIALAIALAIVATWWQLAEHRARQESARADALAVRLVAVRDSLHSAAPARGEAAQPGNAAVLADLATHPDLIPFPAVQGGTMRFIPSESRVLPPRWVYAYFEDGHVAGHGLYEYTSQSGGGYRWKRLAALLD